MLETLDMLLEQHEKLLKSSVHNKQEKLAKLEHWIQQVISQMEKFTKVA